MNAREASARAAKALALLDTLTDLAEATGFDTEHLPEAIARLTEEDWRLAALGAQVRLPSAQTRELVAHLAAKRCAKSDPFAGLK